MFCFSSQAATVVIVLTLQLMTTKNLKTMFNGFNFKGKTTDEKCRIWKMDLGWASFW